MIRQCKYCGAENRIPPEKLDQQAKCGRCKQPLPALSEPLNASSAGEFDAWVSRSAVPVLVDFWAAWCGPCRALAPELARLAQAKQGRVLIVKVDTERLPELASRYGIRSIPTLIRFDDGRETRRASGAMKAGQLEQVFAL